MRAARFHGRYADLLSGASVVLVDVGATGGIQRKWQRLGSALQVLTFEPDNRAFHNLPSGARVQNLPYALGDREGEVQFRQTRFPPASSFFEPDREFLLEFPNLSDHDVVSTAPITVRRLDNALGEVGIHHVDFLKIDTQGADLLVLKGGECQLRSNVFGVQVEVEFNHTYRNRPAFGEIDRYLRGFGFQLFDLQREFWMRTTGLRTGQAKGQLIWADALYLRSIASLLERWRRQSAQTCEREMRIACTLAALHGYFDYAVQICRATEASTVILGGVCAAVERRLQTMVPSSFRIPPHFESRFAQRAHRFAALSLWKMYEWFRPRHRGFVTSDFD